MPAKAPWMLLFGLAGLNERKISGFLRRKILPQAKAAVSLVATVITSQTRQSMPHSFNSANNAKTGAAG